MRVAGRKKLGPRGLLLRALTLAVAGLTVSGCAQGFEQVQSDNRAKMFRLAPGQTRQQVLEEMGTEPQEYNKGAFRSDGIVPNPYDS
ncbi:unnamed protein product, partial [marine sediment metagenome]